MRWPVRLLVIILVTAAVVIGVGTLLPERHVATRTLTLARTPDTVWTALTDSALQLRWRPDLLGLDRLPDRAGRPVWRERSSDGTLVLETTEALRPVRLVRTIVDDGGPFGGTWEYALRRVPEGAELTITERGFVRNPAFRFLARFVFGYTRTLDGQLERLAAWFGEPARIR